MAGTAIHFRRRAYCQIIINGVDVTHELDPHLISLTVIDGGSPGTDRAIIELDDRNGTLPIPANNSRVVVRLGWSSTGPSTTAFPAGAKEGIPNLPIPEDGLPYEGGLQRVFTGGIKDVESGFARRGGGRRLWIEASSANFLEGGKTPKMKTWGEGEKDDHLNEKAQGTMIPISQVMSEAAKAAGYDFQASPAMASISRSFWQQNESFHNLGAKLAQEVGGVFKIKGGTAYLVGMNDGLNVEGKAMPNVTAEWGKNMISWRIKPWTTRADYASASRSAFNIAGGAWDTIKKDIEGGFPFGQGSATLHLPMPAPNKIVAEQTNGGSEQDAMNKRGTGWVVINGETQAQSLGIITIIGARPGVDGQYTMTEVQHNYTRAGGFTTRCTLANPRFLKYQQNEPPVAWDKMVGTGTGSGSGEI
ncbi:MAG: phage late control family protein [Candidatus Saccharibacteria bacterium]|nr:phage late control family protein [Candidatus Saccharibacteria bacterium]